MKETIRKFLSNNPGFKVLSVVLAFLLWLMVYNTEDPDVTRTFTTSVTITNADAVTDMDKCYEVINGSNMVTFAVTAQRSVMDKLDETDFTLTADMDNLVLSEDENMGTVTVEMSVVTRYSSSVRFKSKNKKLEVALENLDSKQFIVSAEAAGTVADGYALGTVSVDNPNVLKVSGPESIVESIDKVVALIDVDGMSQNLIDNVIPVLYDVNGNQISTSRLTLSNSTVTISAKILGTKQVGLVYGWSGTPAGDNTVLGVDISTDTVMIKGTSAVLNAITSIRIPDSALNVDGATGDVVTTVDITEYLPDGAELTDQEDALITLKALIETYGSKTINVPTSSIKVTGLQEGWKLSFENSAYSVVAAGTDSNLNKLDASDIVGSIDVTGMAAGSHSVPVELNLDPVKYTYITVHVPVTITAPETESGAAGITE